MLLPQVEPTAAPTPVTDVQTSPAPVTVAVNESTAVPDPLAAFLLPINR